MAITRISQSTVKEGLEKYNSFYAGLSGLLFGNYESIQTITVGSGGASEIDFTSIPGTYQHLHLRLMGISGQNFLVRLNSDTGSNYYIHVLYGTGAVAGAAAASQNSATVGNISSTQPSAAIVDLLDYASTSKTKVLRSLYGYDENGAGSVGIRSALWNSTSAISTLTIVPNGGTFSQHSTAALYGIKA